MVECISWMLITDMSSAFNGIVVCFLIRFPGIAAEDDKQVSEAAVVALAVVFGFLASISLLAAVRYCYRNYRIKNQLTREKQLEEIGNIIQEHYSESNINNPGLPPDMVLNGYTGGGTTPDKVQRYGDWKLSHPATTVYTSNQPTNNYVIHKRTRSISPSRSPRSPRYERGRSTQRQFVYTLPRSTIKEREPVRAVQPRSRSVPAHQPATTYVRRVDPANLYTQAHFLAIKKPFGKKKYLLPPTMLYQRVVEQPARQIITVPPRSQPLPPPPQPRHQVQQGEVYHVRYEASPNTTVQRGNIDYEGQNISVNHHHSYDSHVVHQNQQSHEGQTIYLNREPSYEDQSHRRFQQNSTDVTRVDSYPIKLTNYKPKVIQSYQQHADENAHVWSDRLYDSDTRPAVWSSDDIYVNARHYQNEDYDSGEVVRIGGYQTKVITASNLKQDAKGNAYTIVDYVDPPNGEKRHSKAIDPDTPLSTSTPRFPTQEIQQLDSVLNASSSSSTSSSPSSSSDAENENHRQRKPSD